MIGLYFVLLTCLLHGFGPQETTQSPSHLMEEQQRHEKPPAEESTPEGISLCFKAHLTLYSVFLTIF